jgi:thymidylate kinase
VTLPATRREGAVGAAEPAAPTPTALVREAFAALEGAGVRWCLLRGEDELDEAGGDLDLLVSENDLARACEELEAAGFVRLPSYGRGTHLFFLGYDPAGDRWVELDVVTDLSYGPFFVLDTGAAPGCLVRRRRAGEAWLLDDDDAFWSLLLHCLLDKRSFSARRRQRLRELARAARADSPLARVVSTVCPPSWCPARLVSAARDEDWEVLAALAFPLTRAWLRRHSRQAAHRLLGRLLARLAEQPAVLRHRRGLSAAVLGPDGAGKSTLVGGLEGSFRFEVRSVYMGLWKRGAPRRLEPLRNVLRIAFRPAVVWRRYFTGRVHQRLGRLVVFDRYVYDALLPPRPPLQTLKRLYFWVLAHACPAPDLVFLLDLPGGAAAARKGEQTVEQLDDQRRHFLALRRRLPELRVVDALQPPARVRAEVTDAIWQRYRARWAAR